MQNQRTQVRAVRHLPNRNHGSSILEFSMALFVGIILLVIPLTGLASFCFRAAIFLAATKTATMAASRARSFSNAKSAAQSSLLLGCASFPGIKLTSTQMSIISRDMSTGASLQFFSALPAEAIDAQKHMYFTRVVANASIVPLFPQQGSFTGISITGLTQPFNYNVATELLTEHPIGLSF